MKIATWNVNSLKVRQQHVIDWLETSRADVLCLQELKLPDEKFPRAELVEKGYRSWYAGQKTYNGVGILVRDGLDLTRQTLDPLIEAAPIARQVLDHPHHAWR